MSDQKEYKVENIVGKRKKRGKIKKEYEVEFIVGKRMKKGKVEYLVRWKGWDRSYDIWRSLKDLNCQDLIDDFEAAAEAKIKAKNKPGEAEEPKQKRKKFDVDVRRNKGLKEPESLGFSRGLTAEKIIGICPHPADGELFHLVKVSRLSSFISHFHNSHSIPVEG